MHERNTTIDFLRGLSVILIILIHVNAYFLHTPVSNFLANYSQFAVQIFVFCSAVVYFDRKKDAPFNLEYIWKRAKRLLIPYYIFLVFFFAFFIFIKEESLSLASLGKWIFLQGNYELDWLVILFFQFLFLMPFIRYIQNKKMLFALFIILSTSSSLLLLSNKLPIHFRLIMWLPWSTILLFGYFYTKIQRRDFFLLFSLISSLLIFCISRYFLEINQLSVTLKGNKYPPNIYYLAYGILGISLLVLTHQKLSLQKLSIQRIFDFASKYSYQIFFIHFLYLFIFIDIPNYKRLQWWGLFIVITILSFGTMWLWSKKDYFFSMLKKAN